NQEERSGKGGRGVAGGSDAPGPAGWGNPVAAVGSAGPSGRPGPWGNGPRRSRGRAVLPERCSFKAAGVPMGRANPERGAQLVDEVEVRGEADFFGCAATGGGL